MLTNEVDVLKKLIAAPVLPNNMYYEPQANPDTCFVHATNMYFQRYLIDVVEWRSNVVLLEGTSMKNSWPHMRS